MKILTCAILLTAITAQSEPFSTFDKVDKISNIKVVCESTSAAKYYDQNGKFINEEAESIEISETHRKTIFSGSTEYRQTTTKSNNGSESMSLVKIERSTVDNILTEKITSRGTRVINDSDKRVKDFNRSMTDTYLIVGNTKYLTSSVQDGKVMQTNGFKVVSHVIDDKTTVITSSENTPYFETYGDGLKVEILKSETKCTETILD